MKKSIKLTLRAIKDLEKAKSFYTLQYGKDKVEEIIDAVFKHLEILENPDNKFSEIGEVDTAFSRLKSEYRKLIKGHFKLTYREGKSKIYVVRIFDARQDPKKNQ